MKKRKKKQSAIEPEVLPKLGSDKNFNQNIDKNKKSNLAISRESKDLVSYDPLVAYLREIKLIPKLTQEEEQNLGIKLYEDKDSKAAYKLISANLWLVVKIAREYERLAKNLLDLIQEGNMGLMEAVKNFDPYRGVRLPSYAVWWIRAYIVRYILANWRLVKIGTTQAQKKLFFNLNKEKERLQREGFYPTTKLLAERLDVKESEVLDMEQRLYKSDLSVDETIGEDDTWHSIIPSVAPNAEEIVTKQEFQEIIDKAINEFKATLTDNYRYVLEKRLLSEDRPTLEDVSLHLGISLERVRQVENRVKEKFKEFMEKNYSSIVSEQE